jgi:hypothetical protein
VTLLALTGLDEKIGNSPTLVDIIVEEDGSVTLDLDVACTALIPLDALLKFRGREQERDELLAAVRAEHN